MNDLPTNWLCLALCLLASLTLCALAFIVARSERDVDRLPRPAEPGVDVDETYRRHITELPEINGER